MATNWDWEGSTGQPRQNSYLQEDLLLLVQVRLPAKSLLRFKCVSKSWNALISDPKFVKMHLDQSRIDPNPNFLIYKDDWYDVNGGSCSLQALTVEYSNQKNFNLTANIHRLLHYPFELQGRRQLHVVGSCNGLLCLHLFGNNELDEEDMVLYNPLIKKPFFFPKRVNQKPFNFCGFGYDDVHDDYKVIVMVSCPREFEFEVYSLKSNLWTTIITSSYQEEDHDYTTHPPAVYDSYKRGLVNRVLHWLLINNTNGKKYIVAFDLSEEKHRILSLPEVIEKSCFGLTVLDDCLVVKSREDVDANGSGFHFWVMKDYGVKDSWMRITTHMPYDIWINTPMSLLNGKRKMVFYEDCYNYKNGMIILYDLVKDQVMDSTIIPGCREGEIHKPKPGLVFVGSFVQPWVTNENRLVENKKNTTSSG